MTKLFVGNLPFSVTDQQLRDLFSKYGNVLSAVIIIDRMRNRSKGFGFVELESDEAAQTAISEMNNYAMDGRNIVVSVAMPAEDKPRRSFGDRNGGRDNNRGGFGDRRFSSRR